ncbi:hypothetical protein PAAG_01783 [Paracoccidioides lutzii Pb01]|uniref:Altered inheritance of mitochondria protein 9, mitochondrial n=1 Tax=Paracoccidioides lutzii (strain ATCC MYA-826 / Pb01) TaxID=502779 RepID=C1GTD8_PARBA|nr:hypothetical protein PAAG_01783 [Paracoccidioides lutzii Pb01]EEH39594.2 hypothetical protein PAAG_01783 [Paracoccidioides lutzii Pb01]
MSSIQLCSQRGSTFRFDSKYHNASSEIAAQTGGAPSYKHISKITDGQYNKVYRFVMDNSAVAIASLPYLTSGVTVYYSTALSVATMLHVLGSNNLGLPGPRVLVWDAKGTVPIGSEYILTEEAKGTQLKEVWLAMEVRDRVAVIKDLVSIHKRHLRWGFLDIEGPIPYKFSDEKLNAQTDRAAKFNELLDFWDMISHLVGQCRWSSNSTYPQAVELLAEMDRERIKSKDTDESIRADFQKWIDREAEQHHHS